MDADGTMEGYRIFPRTQRELFDSLGFVSGDLAVGDQRPYRSTTMAAHRDNQEMSGSGDMILRVMRDGEPIEITIGSNNFGLLAM